MNELLNKIFGSLKMPVTIMEKYAEVIKKHAELEEAIVSHYEDKISELKMQVISLEDQLADQIETNTAKPVKKKKPRK